MQHAIVVNIYLSAALTAASFSDPRGRFKLEVPSSWTRISYGMLEEYDLEIRKEIRKWGAHGADHDLILGFLPNPKWKTLRNVPIHGSSLRGYESFDESLHRVYGRF
jgi:hypothetical protein